MEVPRVEGLLLVEVYATAIVTPAAPIIATHVPMNEAALVLPLQTFALLPVATGLMDLSTMLLMGESERERGR